MRNVRTALSAISLAAVALAAHVALAQGAPPATPPAAPAAPPATAAPEAPASTAGTATPAPSSTAPAQPPADQPAPPPAPPPATSAAPAAPPPAAAAPVAAPPPAPAPAAAPAAAAPGAPPDADKGEKKTKPYESTIALEALVGVNSRLDSTSSGYDNNEHFGMVVGGGLFYNLNRSWSLGLNYQRAQAGAEQFAPGENFASGKLNRTYHSVFANLRAYPLRNDMIGLWAGLSLGATWQNATATGTMGGTMGTTTGLQPYKVETDSKAGLAMALGVGFDIDVSNDVAFLGSVNLMNHFLKSDSLTTTAGEPYVPGSGTSTWLDVRAAFQYRFDLGGAKPPVKASVQTSKR